MLQETALTNILIDAIIQRLVDRMASSVNDDSRANTIKFGRLQDDPTIPVVSLLVMQGDEAWPDVLKNYLKRDDIGGPTYEIGGPYGTITYRIRGVVEIQAFFSGEPTRDTAREKAMMVKHRLKHALLTMPIPDVTDSFGERPTHIQVPAIYLYNSGDDGDFQWRGKCFWEFETVWEPEE